MSERSGSVLRCRAALFAACIVIVTMSAALSACAAVPIAGNGKPTPRAPLNAAERQIATSINAFRRAHNLPSVSVHPNLEDKARLWSAWMAGGGCGHNASGPAICHSDLRSGITVGWSVLEENVGAVTPRTNVAGMISGFEHSPEHEANMLNPRITYVGVGVAYSGNTLFVAEEFMAS